MRLYAFATRGMLTIDGNEERGQMMIILNQFLHSFRLSFRVFLDSSVKGLRSKNSSLEICKSLTCLVAVFSGSKLRMRSHYRARQVAFWNELVPQLHEAGERSRRPELQFEDTGEADQLYSGPVRPSCSKSPRVRVVTAPPTTEPPATTPTPPAAPTSPSAPTSPAPVTTQSLHTISRSHEPGTPSDGGWTYSTVLSVTVTIGCSLLVLNLLIFAGMYYQRKKYEESRKRFQSSAQPSTVSLDLGQGQAPGPGAMPVRRKSVGSGSDCAACKGGSAHQHGGLETGRQTTLPPPNGELNFPVPKPPPPPRGSTLTLPSSESQPLLLHHAGVPPPRRPPSALDELRV